MVKIRIPISYVRRKGPPTPNFRRLTMLLHSKTVPKIAIDREKVIPQHDGVGIKMNFVCDIMEKMKETNANLKVSYDDGIMGVTINEFYDLIFNLDIFTFELYSILDYFALEMSKILRLKWKDRRNQLKDVDDFGTLRKATNLDAQKKLKVEKLTQLPWFEYFHKMRRRIVHRLPISLWGLLYGGKVEFFFLPDEPVNPQSLATKKLSPVMECKKWLDGVFNFVDEMCLDLGRSLFNNF